MSGISLKPWC